MRRQTLFLIPALLGALAASLAIGYLPLRASRALAAPVWASGAAQGLTLDLPGDVSAPALDPGDPWTATEFRGGILGILRIARERPRGDLQAALRAWFELPGALDRPLTYRIQRQPAQARPVTAFGPSGHLVRRQGRLLVAVCVFDLDGYRYWVQARAPASRTALACFHRVLLSMRGPDGARVDPLLAGELRAAEAGLAPGIAQEYLWAAFIPGAVMLLVAALVLAVGRLSGRAPRAPEALGGRFFQAPVEVLLAFRLQRKYFDAAVAVTEDRLVLYTFGTPFLTVRLDALRGRVTEGTGWFAPPYLEIALDGRQDFRKLGRLYAGWAGRIRLRIYTAEATRLRVALGG